MADFIPTREGDLLTYAQRFSATLTSAPGDYGVLASDASALADLVASFSTAFSAAKDPATRTKGKIIAKDLAKGQLISALRQISARIQANPGVSAEQKTDIGLPLRDRIPSPVPAPTTKPVLALLGISGTQQLIRISDEATSGSRAKPSGMIGCEGWAFIGDNPTADLSGWISKGIATRALFTINYSGEESGKLVTLRGRWFNRRGEFGPFSESITARIAGGLSMAA